MIGLQVECHLTKRTVFVFAVVLFFALEFVRDVTRASKKRPGQLLQLHSSVPTVTAGRIVISSYSGGERATSKDATGDRWCLVLVLRPESHGTCFRSLFLDYYRNNCRYTL